MRSAGKLDRRITLQAPNLAQDAAGEPVPSWADVATVWAAVVPLRGRELIAAQSEVPSAAFKVRIRWRSDLTEAMRIQHGGQAYGIQQIAELGRREGLELLVRKPEGIGS